VATLKHLAKEGVGARRGKADGGVFRIGMHGLLADQIPDAKASDLGTAPSTEFA